MVRDNVFDEGQTNGIETPEAGFLVLLLLWLKH